MKIKRCKCGAAPLGCTTWKERESRTSIWCQQCDTQAVTRKLKAAAIKAWNRKAGK